MLSHLHHITSEGILEIDESKLPQLIQKLTVSEHRDFRLEKPHLI